METLLIGWFVFIVYLYVLLLGGGPIRNAIKSVEILQSGLKLNDVTIHFVVHQSTILELWKHYS